MDRRNFLLNKNNNIKKAMHLFVLRCMAFLMNDFIREMR